MTQKRAVTDHVEEYKDCDKCGTIDDCTKLEPIYPRLTTRAFFCKDCLAKFADYVRERKTSHRTLEIILKEFLEK
jgi:hypothetical protein